jgi:hypothetical protein
VASTGLAIGAVLSESEVLWWAQIAPALLAVIGV